MTDSKPFQKVQHNVSKLNNSSTHQSQANEKSSIIFQKETQPREPSSPLSPSPPQHLNNKETKRTPTHQISNINKPIRIHLNPFPFGPVPQQPAHRLRDLDVAGESRASFSASASAAARHSCECSVEGCGTGFDNEFGFDCRGREEEGECKAGGSYDSLLFC